MQLSSKTKHNIVGGSVLLVDILIVVAVVSFGGGGGWRGRGRGRGRRGDAIDRKLNSPSTHAM